MTSALLVAAQGVNQRRIVHRPRETQPALQLRASEGDRARVPAPSSGRPAEAFANATRRLRRGAEHDRASIVARQFVDGAQARTRGVAGCVCASSSTITDPRDLCSLRQRDGRVEYRLSNNWTLVVTTMGAAQSSIARRSLSRACPRFHLLFVDGAMVLENDIARRRTSRKILAV